MLHTLTPGFHSNEAVLHDVNATHSVLAPGKERVTWIWVLPPGLGTLVTH